jgi:hypothetical protein
MSSNSKTKLTDEIYALIPALVAQGKTKVEIAETYGVTPGTLQVQCSLRDISLRPGGKRGRRRLPVVTETVPIAAREPVIAEAVQIASSLRREAKARGMGEIALVLRLIEIIVKDKLYDAVLGTVDEPIDA